MKRLNSLLLFVLGVVTVAQADMPKSDEQVILFPALAWRLDDPDAWRVEIHGWIFEPQLFGRIHAWVTDLFGHDDYDTEEHSLLRQRMHWFAVDNERGKALSIALGGRIVELAESAANGHFTSEIALTRADIEGLRGSSPAARRASYHIVTGPDDTRTFSGEILLLERRGVSVISDIDDTIKVSDVTDKSELIKNTFARPFQPVPGMAELYRRWAAAHAEFHYLSASPWQLYPALAEFIRAQGFPDGSFHLKLFRVKDSSFFDLFQDSQKYKTPLIEALLRRYPERRFVLVGDSGERDPETYADVARRFPRHIGAILIREAGTGAPDRYKQAFDRLPDTLWRVFHDPAELETFMISR